MLMIILCIGAFRVSEWQTRNILRLPKLTPTYHVSIKNSHGTIIASLIKPRLNYNVFCLSVYLRKKDYVVLYVSCK